MGALKDVLLFCLATVSPDLWDLWDLGEPVVWCPGLP